ncbi:MAG: DnaJ domain-containing protein [Anaerolineae bacterium]|nr:DnaJ domain-containing protein [Anaerolineae bacterium]
MNVDRLKIEQLYAEIERKRAELTRQRDELTKLRTELDGFAELYDKLVGRLQAELDGLWQEIESLQWQERPLDINNYTTGSIWGPYGSMEEAFDAKYRQGPKNDSIRIEMPTRSSASDDELKSLYRKLARKYHPDTTTDPEEKARRTVIMAQINAAYRSRNFKELQALDFGVVRKQPVAPPPPPAQAQKTMADLVNTIHQLQEEIDWTKIEHQKLMTSPLMQFKIEVSLARGQGRDLLRDIAAALRNDLAQARKQLAGLRAQRR